MLGIFALALTGCWNKGENSNAWQVDTLEDLFYKFPLMLEDMDRINANKSPMSYEYSVYSWITVVETGYFEYKNNVNYDWLLRSDNEVVWKQMVSSQVKYGIINTAVDVTLDNWDTYRVVYAIDPNTLEYVNATVSTLTGSILYEFKY